MREHEGLMWTFGIAALFVGLLVFTLYMMGNYAEARTRFMDECMQHEKHYVCVSMWRRSN